jgi:hypothetical protein
LCCATDLMSAFRGSVGLRRWLNSSMHFSGCTKKVGMAVPGPRIPRTSLQIDWFLMPRGTCRRPRRELPKLGRYRARATMACPQFGRRPLFPRHVTRSEEPLRSILKRLDRRTAPSGPVRLVPWMGAYAQPYPDRILILRPVPRPLGNLVVRPSLSPIQSFGRRPARATQMEPSGSRLQNVRTKP